MELKLPYGKKGKTVMIPEGTDLEIIYPRWNTGLKPEQSDEELIEAGINHPYGKHLAEIISPVEQVGIVVSDITRPVPVARILKIIINKLKKIGISERNLLIITATGLHRAHTAKELQGLLGKYYGQLRVIDHNAYDQSNLVQLGTTSRGTPIIVNKALTEIDKIITVGYITPHPRAGFSGGGKSIVPGVAGAAAINKIHRLEWMLDPNCVYISVENNPMYQDIKEFSAFIGIDFLINVVLQKGRVLKTFAGDFKQTHQAGIDFVKKHTIINREVIADLVLVTPGGYPLDHNLYQATKGLAAAWLVPSPLVKKRGEVILFSKCQEGLGKGHEKGYQVLIDSASPELAVKKMLEKRDSPIPGTWGTITWATLRQYAQITIVSEGIADDLIRKMKMKAAETVFEAIILAKKRLGNNLKLLIIPYGPETIISKIN